jgi:hypothetical protein
MNHSDSGASDMKGKTQRHRGAEKMGDMENSLKGRNSALQLDTFLAGSTSREAVTACSPRRKPGVTDIIEIEPRKWRQAFRFLPPHPWLSMSPFTSVPLCFPFDVISSSSNYIISLFT